MPNWCDNSLTLTHPDSTKIDALEAEMSKKSDNGHFLGQPFQHLRPNPSGEWDYNWSCENWGTKWDADIIDFERVDTNEFRMYFNSAWSPPVALYEHLVTEGWGVDALYHESGMGYAGMFTTDGGDDYYEYDISDQNTIDDLPGDLQDFAGLEDAHQSWKENVIEEYLSSLERTEWYVGQLPARDGRYEVTTKAWDFPQWAEFKDGSWSRWVGDEIEVTKWRGLTEEFTDVKYQEMIDTIAENN